MRDRLLRRLSRHLTTRGLVWRQVRYTLIVTVTIGLVLSFIQLLVDGIREASRMRAIAEGIVLLVEAPASRAAYTLDSKLAETVESSLLELPSVLEMSIADDHGRVLASGAQTPAAGGLRWLTRWIFGPTIDYALDLTPEGQAEATAATSDQVIGHLHVVLDTHILANDFVARSRLLIVTSMVRTLILGIVLSLVFYWLVTRPLMQLAATVGSINPEDSERSLTSLSAVRSYGELSQLTKAISRLVKRTGRAIDEHRQVEVRLEASETKFLAAADSMPDGLAILDAEDQIVFYNSKFAGNMPPALAATIRVGRRFEDCLKEAYATGDVYHPEMGDDVAARRIEAHRRGEGESLLHLSDDRFVRLRMSRMRDGGRVMLSTDITERKRLEDDLNQAEKLTAVGTLASGIAHDFNNILATIFASAEVALARQPAEGGAISSLERILTAGRRGRDLVNQILAFSRTEKRPALAIDLNRSVDNAVNLARPTLPKNVSVRLERTDKPLFIAADDTQIHQIIANLCRNSAQAMRSGGAITISTAVDRGSSTKVRLIVRDTGPGMAKDVAERVFEPFFTTKPVGEGTGLGLAVVHGIVKSLSGSIAIDTAPGAGCRVTIEFPQIHGDTVVTSLSRPQPPQGDFRTVMIVESDDDVGAAITSMLRPAGYRLVRYREAERALVHFDLSRERPAVLILGMSASSMRAPEIAEIIGGRDLDIPIVCTVENEKERQEMSASLPKARFIRRPILRRELNAALHHFLGDTETT